LVVWYIELIHVFIDGGKPFACSMSMVWSLHWPSWKICCTVCSGFYRDGRLCDYINCIV
jgi:hypothetical protein